MIQTLCFDRDSFIARFPASLWSELPSPEPKQLWLRGSSRGLDLLLQLPELGLAVVGTRGPQPRSLQLVEHLLSQAAHSPPLIVISGLARGIDAAAHSAALKWGLPTLAILGSGFDQPYPAERERLMKRILETDGVLISEYPPEMPALPHQFLNRNRIIAGWSAATWVVEAGQRSGALNTARWARDLGRPVFATPAFPGDPWFAGNLKLLSDPIQPARPLTCAADLGSEWLGLATASQQSHPTPRVQLSTPLGALIQQVESHQSQRGGISTYSLLNWALGQGWAPDLFFKTLQMGLEQGEILEKKGILLRAFP